MEPLKTELSDITRNFRFVRSIFGEDLLENFFVSAVASVLAIRLYLYLTGYPQVGSGNIHIAHMLWGGLFMLAAVFILMGFLTRPAYELAAVLGGIGFGAFIDEIGKFITNDNNYFFEPSIAIIYVTFIVIYLAIRWVFNHRPLSHQEYLANTFEILKHASINGLDEKDERAVLDLLDQSGTGDPLVNKLREILPCVNAAPSRKSHVLNRLKYLADSSYQNAVKKWWFTGAIVVFFAITAITTFYSAVALIEWPWTMVVWIVGGAIILLSLLQFWEGRIPNLRSYLSAGIIAITIVITWSILANRGNIRWPFAEWAQFVCSSISATLIIIGIILMARSRCQAYRMFRRAILVSILLTQVFAFYQYQFLALLGLLGNVVILFALRYMISHEQDRSALKTGSTVY
jgi:hypothetical protein